MFTYARLLTLGLGLFVASSLMAYPSGIDIAGPIKSSGSDSTSKNYNAFKESSINSYFKNIGFDSAGSNFSPKATSAVSLVTDPALSFKTDVSIRAYFISSDAGFNNTLGITSNNSISTDSSKLIFPNASDNASSPNKGDANAPYAALTAGSFVDVGTLKAGVPLNLFLIADGADGTAQGSVFSKTSLNSDASVHVKMVQFLGTNYYLVGFEDTLGIKTGDFDYNDLVIALAIVPTPEPGTYILLSSLLVVIYLARRKQKQATN